MPDGLTQIWDKKFREELEKEQNEIVFNSRRIIAAVIITLFLY